MAEYIEFMEEGEDYGMKFIEKIEPSSGSGKISVEVTQQVQITKPDGEVINDELKASKEFLIASRAFTLDVSDVYSVSPAENACGNFANELPHITLCKRTIPWEFKSSLGEPWLALIPLSGREYEEKDMTIAELKQNKEDIYFPVSAQPAVYLEKDTDLCHVIDMDKALFQKIAPRKGERSLLAHGKFLNLLQKTDETVKMDGYFSTVVGGRFVPTADTDAVKSTIHLVSMLGYDEPEKLPADCVRVRLVSLYHWSVFSRRDEEAGFVSLMKGLQCDVLRIDKANTLLQHGYVPPRHLFRSGESTVSLYRGPLVPFRAAGAKQKEEAAVEKIPATSDGALIFDRETSLFDASYSAAWQMGRLLTLRNKGVVAAIVKWRKRVETILLKRAASDFMNAKMKEEYSAKNLAEKAVKHMLYQLGNAREEADAERREGEVNIDEKMEE